MKLLLLALLPACGSSSSTDETATGDTAATGTGTTATFTPVDGLYEMGAATLDEHGCNIGIPYDLEGESNQFQTEFAEGMVALTGTEKTWLCDWNEGSSVAFTCSDPGFDGFIIPDEVYNAELHINRDIFGAWSSESELRLDWLYESWCEGPDCTAFLATWDETIPCTTRFHFEGALVE